MKRLFYLALCLFLVSALVFSIAACGDDESDGGAGTTEPSSNQTDKTTNSGSGGTTDTSTGVTNSSTGTTDSSNQGNTNSSIDGGTTDSSEEGDTVDSGEKPSDSSQGTTSSSSDQGNSTDSSKGMTESSTQDSTTDSNVSGGTTDSSQGTETPGTPDVEDPHEHTFAQVYSYNGSTHYYAATCEHVDEKKGLEFHSYNQQGVCKCGHTIDLSFDSMIKAILENKGAIKASNSNYVSNNIEFNSVGANNIISEFYDEFLYIKDENDNIDEYYYSHDKNGEVFGICVQNGGVFVYRVDEATDSHYNGARYTLACIGDGETIVFGAEALVEYLYKLGLDNVNGDFTTSENEGVYSFSYKKYVDDDWKYFYEINVSLGVDEATGAMLSANITVNRYGEGSYTSQQDGTYALNDGANPNMVNTFVITQAKSLEESKENPYSYDRIALDGVTIKDGKGNNILQGVVRIRAGESLRLVFSDIRPSSALLELCKISVSMTNKLDGSEVDIAPFFNSYDSSYSFTIDNPGAYTLVVMVDDVQFIATVEVDLKIPVTMGAQVYNSDLGGFKQARKVTAYAGAPVYFTSYVPLNYDGTYEAYLDSEYGTGVSVVSGELNGQAVSVFKADSVGSYVVNITSTVDPYLVTQLRIDVVEAPPLEDFLVGEYFANDQYGNEMVRVEFDSEHNAIVTYPKYETYETLSCTVVDGNIVFESIDGDSGLVTSLRLDESYNLIIGIDDRSVGEITLTRVVVETVLVSSGTINIKSEETDSTSVKYGFEYYSNNKFIIYNGYSVTNEIALFNDNGTLSLRYIGSDKAVELVKTSGEQDTLEGEYNIPFVVDLYISMDETATAIKEPAFGILQVIDLETSDKMYSAYYSYEIVDGEYVFYKDGEVTDEITLSGEPGMLLFTYPGTAYAISPVKIVGEEDVLGGEYNINFNLVTIYTGAKVIIYAGASMEDIYATSEPDYGALIIENDDGNREAYSYEKINDKFVIYKNGRRTTEIAITIGLDGKYRLHTAGSTEPLSLVKIQGGDKVLAGVYTASEDITVTFEPGNVSSEPMEGMLELIDDHNSGNLSGKYMYSFVNGSIVVYDRDGNMVEDFKFTTNIDGSYSFQSLTNNLLVPHSLVKYDGMTVLFGGVYHIIGESGTPIYTITFVPGGTIEDVYVEQGALSVTDNNDQAIGGAYSYAITDDGRIVIFKDGEKTSDILIVATETGYTFQCASLAKALGLVKVKGEKGMLSGVYKVVDGKNTLYELTITAEGYEMPTVAEGTITNGKNDVTIPADYIGINLTYTATKDGKFDFSFTGITSDVEIYLVNKDGTLARIQGAMYTGASFASGDSLTLYFISTTAEEHSISIKVEEKKTELPPDEF